MRDLIWDLSGQLDLGAAKIRQCPRGNVVGQYLAKFHIKQLRKPAPKDKCQREQNSYSRSLKNISADSRSFTMETVTSAIESTLERLNLRSPAEATLVQPTSGQVSELRDAYAKYAQEHVFTFWGDLKSDEQAQLYHQLASIDPA